MNLLIISTAVISAIFMIVYVNLLIRCKNKENLIKIFGKTLGLYLIFAIIMLTIYYIL